MQNNTPLRINRFLALCGLGSRRDCERLVADGRVALNGSVIFDLSTQINASDLVEVDGKTVSPSGQLLLIALNKPPGYLCSAKDPHGRPTIYELLPPEYRHLHYVGRLDYQTRGLLLLTNDGELSQRLTQPKYGLIRRYQVRLDKPLGYEEKDLLESGVILADGTEYQPARLDGVGREFEIELYEGKKREIREMMRHIGCRVIDLRRIEYGGIRLEGLREGEVRSLDEDEVRWLQKGVGLLTDRNGWSAH